jgi:glucose 1-dehydrogenase
MGLLENKIALITGGVSGLGRACAQRFIENGASVVIADINIEKGKNAESKLLSAGGDVCFVEVDVTDEESQKNLFHETVERFQRVDVVVAAAGISSAAYVSGQVNERSEDPEANYLFNKSVSDWRRVLEVNLTGVMLTNQLAVKSMIGTDVKGSIINIASIAGKRPLPGASDYCVSKSGVIMLTQALSAEVSGRGIRVNAIGPGFIETPMTAGIRQSEEGVAGVMAMTPMNRFGIPNEIASTALFLASDESSYFSGQTLFPNGGMFTG